MAADCTGNPHPIIPRSAHLPIIEITARHNIQPLHQGKLDGLCGLYAAINALRLVLHDHHALTNAGTKRLFEQGAFYLERKGALREALAHGMETRRWHGLVRHMVKRASPDTFSIELERAAFGRKPAIGDIFDWIDASLSRNSPALIQLDKGLNHFSVVAASTQSSLHLFDSCGHRFVKRTSCGIQTGFHHIPPNALLRMTARQRC